MNNIRDFESALRSCSHIGLANTVQLHRDALRRGDYWITRRSFAIPIPELATIISKDLCELPSSIRGTSAVRLGNCVMGSLRNPIEPGMAVWVSGSAMAENTTELGLSFLSRIFQDGERAIVRNAS